MLRNEIFDSKFNRLGILERFTYCQYVEKLNDVGTFTLKCRANKDDLELLVNNNIIWFEDDVAGIIQSVTIENTGFVTINGCLANVILDWRYVYPVFSGSGKVDVLMNNVVASNCIENENVKRNYDFLEIENVSTSLPTISKQKTGGTVLELENELASAHSCGFKVSFYPKEKKMKFRVLEGVDRTIHNNKSNAIVVFAESLNNIKSSTYTDDESNYRNVTLVAGEATAGSRSFVIVTDNDEVEKSGFERRELYTDARDIQSDTVDEDGNTIILDSETYQKTITSRGKEKLAEYAKMKSLESDVRSDVASTYQYRKDYNLGDFVTVMQESLNTAVDVQITAVTVTQDASGYSVTPTVGNARPELYSVLKKKGVVL